VSPALAEAARVTGIQSLGHLLGVRPVPPEVLEGLDAAYDGSVLSADRATGKILAALEREGILKGALTIVTSDHGENLGEHGELEHRMSVYEPVLRVPLVVSWPGRLDGGKGVDAQVRLQDLYPTMLEAARVPVPPRCGKDATSLLENPIVPRTVVAQYGPMSGFLKDVRGLFPEAGEDALRRLQFEWLAVREPSATAGARKYIAVTFHPEGGSPRPEREELYDLAADPGETRNLLGPGAGPAEREAVDRLRRQVK
jgi:arylsulfatase A-like enzyme